MSSLAMKTQKICKETCNTAAIASTRSELDLFGYVLLGLQKKGWPRTQGRPNLQEVRMPEVGAPKNPQSPPLSSK
jgi:hypothetical protein